MIVRAGLTVCVCFSLGFAAGVFFLIYKLVPYFP